MLDIQKRMSGSFYTLLSMPSTAMGFALSVQISALSWILSTKYGLDIHEIGIVWAAGPIAGIIAQPIVGLVSDNTWFLGGRRRPWIIIGGVLAALMMLALPNLEIIQKIFVGGDDPQAGLLSIAVIVALTFDLSINVSLNPTRSLIADCTTMEQRSKGYTWMQTISGSFGVLAYLVGAVLGNMTLLYIGMAITLLGTVVPAFMIEEPRELQAAAEEKRETREKNSVRDIASSITPLLGFLLYGAYVIVKKLVGVNFSECLAFGPLHLDFVELVCAVLVIISGVIVVFNLTKSDENSSEFQKILYAHSFTWVGVQSMFIYALFFIQQMADADGSVIVLGHPLESGMLNSYAFFLLSLISAILPIFVLNRFSGKIGMVRTHTACILIMALGYAGISLIGHSATAYLLLIAVCGIGWASVVSLPFAIMSERVDQNKMGLYMGIFNLSVVLPQLVSSFKIGEVVNAVSDKGATFTICAVCLAISAVMWLFVKNDKK